jgi:hypothetical protein
MSTIIGGTAITPPTAGGGASILDSVAVKNAMEAYTIENYFQGKLHVDGRGYTSRYVTDMSLRSVSIPHQLLPSLGIAREVGATTNGAAINTANLALIGGAENGYLEDDVYNVNLTYVFDQFFYVSEILATLGGQRKLEQFTTNNLILAKNREQTVSLLAKQLYAGIVIALTRLKDQVTAYTPTTDDIAKQIFGYDPTKIGAFNQDATSPMNTFTAANGQLDNGDPDTFLGMVQADQRQAFARSSFKTKLIQTNQVINADVGLMQQYTGYIDPFDGSAKFLANTGSFGNVNNVLMTWVDEQLWAGCYSLYNTAKAKPANWFGLDQTNAGHQAVIALLDTVRCLIVAAQGTYHGVADDARVNVNPYAGRNPREMRIEPFARWGNAVLVPKSVKVIIEGTTIWTPTNVQAIASAVPTIQPPANLA